MTRAKKAKKAKKPAAKPLRQAWKLVDPDEPDVVAAVQSLHRTVMAVEQRLLVEADNLAAHRAQVESMLRTFASSHTYLSSALMSLETKFTPPPPGFYRDGTGYTRRDLNGKTRSTRKE